MIPRADLEPVVPLPPPACPLPDIEELGEENFGWFQGTIWMGTPPIDDTVEVLSHEARLIEGID